MAESYLQHGRHYFRLIARLSWPSNQGGRLSAPAWEVLAEEGRGRQRFRGIPTGLLPSRAFFSTASTKPYAQPQPGPAQPTIDRPSRTMATDKLGDRQARQTGSEQNRVSPGGSVARVRSAPFQDRNYRTVNTKPTRKALSGTAALSSRMAADVIRKTAAAVDAGPAIPQ